MQGRSSISADRLTALILIGIFIVYGFEGHALESALGVDVVGPGFFPSAIAILGIGAGVILLVSSESGPDAGESGTTAKHLRALLPVGVLLIYVLSLDYIGYPIATFAFLALMFRYFGAPSWWHAVFFALLATAIAVLIFVYGLHVRLPRGVLVSFW